MRRSRSARGGGCALPARVRWVRGIVGDARFAKGLAGGRAWFASCLWRGSRKAGGRAGAVYAWRHAGRERGQSTLPLNSYL
jgi:hypothetical protein